MIANIIRDGGLRWRTMLGAFYTVCCISGQGVDVILDCVGGGYWQQNTDVLSMDGRWVLYGLLGKFLNVVHICRYYPGGEYIRSV